MGQTKEQLQVELQRAEYWCETFEGHYKDWLEKVAKLRTLLEEQQKAEAKDKEASPADIGKTVTVIGQPSQCRQPVKYTDWEYEHFWKAHTDKVVEDCAMDGIITTTQIRVEIQKKAWGIPIYANRILCLNLSATDLHSFAKLAYWQSRTGMRIKR